MTTKHIIPTLLLISVLMGCEEMTPKQYFDKLLKPDGKTHPVRVDTISLPVTKLGVYVEYRFETKDNKIINIKELK